MAVSAFKSNSRRGNFGYSSNNTSSAKDSELTKKVPPTRRSRSVSAVVRNYQDKEIPSSASSSSSSTLTSTVDFLNKRDNPLFYSSSLSPPDVVESENVIGIVKLDEQAFRLGEAARSSVGSGGVSDSRRGRSVTRHSDNGNQSLATGRGLGRSLSRVDMGRPRRSVSRGHYGNSESDAEKEKKFCSNLRNKNNGKSAPSLDKKAVVTTRASELSAQTRNLHRWSSQHPLLEPSDGSVTPNLEDEISTGSFSEAEEKTIRAVFEQMKTDRQAGDSDTSGIYETVRSEVRRAISEMQNDLENVIQRSTTIGATNFVDIPPESVDPDAIELVSDIRKEYARKLELSQERARKLRAELTMEEHRGQELNRILKEILPDPKSSAMQKPQPRRKTSIERRKMSKRLTEEAMNYFDECVSISTFDSSDFSSPEDPPFNSVAATPSVGDSRFMPCGSSSASTSHCANVQLNCNKDPDAQVLYTPCKESSVLTAGSCSKEASNDQRSLTESDTEQVGSSQFSHEPTATSGLLHDIRIYIKKFEKENHNNERDCQTRLSSYDADDYKLHYLTESLLFDRVILKNRIRSGSLLLCASSVVI